jgi:undecaprenyl-diphosphatase
LIGLDKHLEHFIVDHRIGWLDWFFIGLSRVGTLGVVWVVIAAVLTVLWRRPWLLAGVVSADVIADSLAGLGKALVQRHRPFVTQLGPKTSTHSFPSGHSATSFACALMLATAAPRLRVPAFTLAALIAFSRLYNGDHFPIDVIAGSVLGLLVATALLRLGAIRRRSRPALRQD